MGKLISDFKVKSSDIVKQCQQANFKYPKGKIRA